MRIHKSYTPLKYSYAIPFHKPDTQREEIVGLREAITSGSWIRESEEGHRFFKSYYPNSHCFFTSSCSSALEMAIRVLGIGPGDEVIIPGFGYVAVANAVVNNGAKPVFADVHSENGNIAVHSVESCISPLTKAVIAIHYAGHAFDVNCLLELCNKHQIFLVEDAAQCIGSSLQSKHLGSSGHLGCLSFDYMKNISCGQGGLLIVNEPSLLPKVQTMYDNGTNRQALIEGSQAHFNWLSKGSNYQINPLASYFLSAQLNSLKEITEKRINSWNLYHQLLLPLHQLGKLTLRHQDLLHNGHIFYLVCSSEKERLDLRNYLMQKQILSEPHYSSLVSSTFGKQFYNAKNLLQNSEILCRQLLRLPLWNSISESDIHLVAETIYEFYNQ